MPSPAAVAAMVSVAESTTAFGSAFASVRRTTRHLRAGLFPCSANACAIFSKRDAVSA